MVLVALVALGCTKKTETHKNEDPGKSSTPTDPLEATCNSSASETAQVACNDLGDKYADGKNGVTADLASCHTAFVEGYFVEGHVPAEDVARLLAERPDAAGLTAPGMPLGSPGMEGAGAEPYQVLLVRADGTSEVFASH